MMKYDTIIIGSGLAGLVAGIRLAEQGQKCLMVAKGQSTLHFFSGSFDLFGCDGNPFEAINWLDKSHPYSKIGKETLLSLANEIKPFFEKIGIKLFGENTRNHYRITPLGELAPTWLTLDGFATVESVDTLSIRKAVIINITGFLDFQPSFLAAGLAKRNVECNISEISISETEQLRKSPSEMRSTNIAKTLVGDDVINRLAMKINDVSSNAEMIFMPAVLKKSVLDALQNKVKTPIRLISTLPPSVAGFEIEQKMRTHFQKLGGTILNGDTVVGGEFDGARLKSICTENHGMTLFEANRFVLASGSFVSRGIVATREKVFEPIFNIDIDFIESRAEWFNNDIFEQQPYMRFGVATDDDFRVKRNGKTVENLYAIGSILSGANAIEEKCGGGLAIMTAFGLTAIFNHEFHELTRKYN